MSSPIIAHGVGFGGVHYMPTLGLSPTGVVASYGRRVRVRGARRSRIRVRGSRTMAVTMNVAVYEGEDITLEVDLPEAATGWAMTFSVRDEDNGTLLFTMTTGGGTITIDGDDSSLVLVAIAAASLAVTPGEYFWSLARTDSGYKSELANGRFDVLASQAL